MVRPDKYRHTLRAIHQICVWGRSLARDDAPAERFERVFDWLELIPALIDQPEDNTEQIRDAISACADAVGAPGIVANFDEVSPPERW